MKLLGEGVGITCVGADAHIGPYARKTNCIGPYAQKTNCIGPYAQKTNCLFFTYIF